MERTEIEELIEQAKAAQRRWRKPQPRPYLSKRTWDEILDGRPSPGLRVAKL